MISDKLKSIEHAMERACEHGMTVEGVRELQHRVKDVREQAERWEASACSLAAVEKMREAILHILNRAVIDYSFGQLVCPYSRDWELLISASAAVQERCEPLYNDYMVGLWKSCPQPINAPPRLTAEEWLREARQ